MGCVRTINYDSFPKQGSHLGKRVRVMYHYEDPLSGERPQGIVVRDDVEEPGVSIIQLDDGRFILTTECQYSLI